MPTAHDAIIWLPYDVMCFVLLPRLLYAKKNLVEPRGYPETCMHVGSIQLCTSCYIELYPNVSGLEHRF